MAPLAKIDFNILSKLIALLTVSLPSIDSLLHINTSFGATPKFCVDDKVIELFQPRFTQCLSGGSASAELEKLKQISTVEFTRGHELLAHMYFMDKANPHRVSCESSLAEMEYVPLLPLAWRQEMPSGTLCTSGGYCKKDESKRDPNCNYQNLIRDILKYVKHVKDVRGKEMHEGLPKFSVASTYNMRTSIGFGLPSSNRNGPVYNSVTSWVKATHVGHYERIPQCPDVLRKWWKHVVEIPYLPIQSELVDGEIKVALNRADLSERTTTFYFSGRTFLWGPERVCSVRCAMATLATRSDTVVMSLSEEQSYGPPLSEPLNQLYDSIFCLITKGDSYSTSFFYDSIQSGCLPVVVSDWFIFSFPWFIEYREFAIRVSEEDFLKDPNGVLDAIIELYPRSRIKSMRERMRYWRDYLSFEVREIEVESSPTDSPRSHRYKGVLPFELLLREIKYVQVPESVFKDVPCYSPYTCKPRLSPVEIAGRLKETRSHLCQHVSRLIGHYKIVYFMQCTRILWPIRLGSFKPIDLSPKGLPVEDKEFVLRFHNVNNSRPEGWSWTTYPPFSEEVTRRMRKPAK